MINAVRIVNGTKFFTQIADIEVHHPSGPLVQAKVTWRGSGDDGNKVLATSYEIRHSTAQITEANFGAATLPPGAPPVPQSPGTLETFSFSEGLTPSTLTWFGVQTADDQGNTSLVVISATTPSP